MARTARITASEKDTGAPLGAEREPVFFWVGDTGRGLYPAHARTYERGVALYVLMTLFQWLFSQADPACLYWASTLPFGA